MIQSPQKISCSKLAIITRKKTVIWTVFISVLFYLSANRLRWFQPYKYKQFNSKETLQKTVLHPCDNPGAFINEILICKQFSQDNPAIGLVFWSNGTQNIISYLHLNLLHRQVKSQISIYKNLEISQNITIQVYTLQRQLTKDGLKLTRTTQHPFKKQQLKVDTSTFQHDIGYLTLNSDRVYYFKVIFSDYNQFKQTLIPSLMIRTISFQYIQFTTSLRYCLFFMVILIFIYSKVSFQDGHLDSAQIKVMKVGVICLILFINPFFKLYFTFLKDFAQLSTIIPRSLYNIISTLLIMTWLIVHLGILSSIKSLNPGKYGYLSYIYSCKWLIVLLVLQLMMLLIQYQTWMFSEQFKLIVDQGLFKAYTIVLTLLVLAFIFYDMFGYSLRSQEFEKNQRNIVLDDFTRNFRILSLPIQLTTIAYICLPIFYENEFKIGITSNQYLLFVTIYVLVLSYLILPLYQINDKGIIEEPKTNEIQVKRQFYNISERSDVNLK